MFKEVGKLIEKHGVREFVPFAGWRAVDTEQVRYSLTLIVQELCESRGGRHGLSVLTSLLVSVDVKL